MEIPVPSTWERSEGPDKSQVIFKTYRDGLYVQFAISEVGENEFSCNMSVEHRLSGPYDRDLGTALTFSDLCQIVSREALNADQDYTIYD